MRVYLFGHYFAIMMGEQLALPWPQKANKIVSKIGTLIKRIELRDNYFFIDVSTLRDIKKDMEQSITEDNESLFDNTMEKFFSWSEVNNIWIGTKKYHKKTWMKADNGYKIGR